MKSNCLVCQKSLSKKSAKHCKSHVPITKARRKKYALRMKGNTRGFQKGQSAWNKGKSAVWALGNKNPNWGKFGSQHPKWTGRTTLTKSIRQCEKYKTWRSSVFKKDDFTCQICNKRGVYLEADHFPISFASILNKYKIKTYEQALHCRFLWEANGRTLCKPCHPRPGRLPKKIIKLSKINIQPRHFLTNKHNNKT